jgi:hypothetical protein
MAAKLLLPGAGGSTTEDFTESSTTTGHTYDCRNLGSVTIQQDFNTGTPSGTFQMQRSLDQTNWESIGGAITATDGRIDSYDRATYGSLGTLRVDGTNLGGSSVVLQLKIEGGGPVLTQ